MSRYQMPEVKIPANFSEADRAIAEACLNKGKLRASKPKEGQAAYVWRMLAFYVSPVSQHQCMPITADWDMQNQHFPSPKFPPGTRWDDPAYRAAMDAHRAKVDARRKELDAITDALLETASAVHLAELLLDVCS